MASCTALATSAALPGLHQRRAAPAGSSTAGSVAALPRRQRRRGAAAAALPLGLLADLPAQASEAFIDTTAGIPDVGQAVVDAAAEAADAAQTAAAAEALAAAQAAAANDPSELVFTALFGVAVAALTVVTLGVAYLSFTSWMDSRTEADDRRRISGMGGISSGSGNGAAPKKAPKKKEAAVKEPEEFKGFGSKK